ncbi:SEC-C metal-binding domain-containing protein [Alkalibacter mobilis]|uniref:SEC-C metal-binding domain-containing protein n=1 Tax=Alkalibacter mobilis TaxID=2787712 RepID=UPI00189E0B71|nr:SEC-C metal-binding domain-containing protein [Alkalibacter mobilis]MBF7096945.1 SEC-C domain-containing protein [Alkalibacter mobilis]
MALYEEWKNIIEKSMESEEKQQEFWDDFCGREQKIYEKILGEKQGEIKGKISDLAQVYGVDTTYFMGFLDGINDSIKEPNDLEKLSESDTVQIDIDFEKLYYNMLAVPAPWLYELEQWEGILSAEKRKAITKEYNRSKTIVKENKVGRNDPCPCGSGKKYKKCCGKAS